MRNIDKDIERLFAEKVQEGRTPVPEFIWEEVAKAIPPKKKNRMGGWLLWLLGPLCLLTIAGDTHSTSVDLTHQEQILEKTQSQRPLADHSQTQSAKAIQMEVEPEENQQTTSRSLEFLDLQKQQTTEAATSAKDIFKKSAPPSPKLADPESPRTKKPAQKSIASDPVADPPGLTNQKAQSPASLPVLDNSGNGSSGSQNTDRSDQSEQTQQGPPTTNSENDVQADALEVDYKSTNPADAAPLAVDDKVTNQEDSASNTALSNPALEVPDTTESFPPQTPPESTPEEPGKSEEKATWFLSGFGGPNRAFRLLDSKIHSELVQHKNKQEEGIFGFDAGLSLSRRKGRLELGSGLFYTLMGEAYDFSTPTISHQTKNTYSYLGLPLFAGYELGSLGHLTFRPRLEVTTFFLTHAQASWLDPFTHDAVLKAQKVNKPYRKMALGSRVNLEISWPISNRFSALVRPGASIFITSIYRKEEGLDQTPYSFDLDFGLTYRLGW